MKEITFLTLSEVIDIHTDEIKRYGGAGDIVYINLLASLHNSK